MARVEVTLVVNRRRLVAEIAGRNSQVILWIERNIIDAIQRRAQQFAPIDRGVLRSDIQSERIDAGTITPSWRVGNTRRTPYSKWVHEGTGVFGPRGAPIVPKNGPYLVFKSRRTGDLVFAKSVQGQKPQPYLRAALESVFGGLG